MEQDISQYSWIFGLGELALINACLAQIKKNMNDSEGFGGLAWFFITLFTGPFATLFIVIFKKPTNL
jgi:hypothetical protein